MERLSGVLCWFVGRTLKIASGPANFWVVFRDLTRFGSKKVKQSCKGKPLPLLQKPDGSFTKDFQKQQQIWKKQFSELEAGEVLRWEPLARLNQKGVGVPAGMHEVDLFKTEFALKRGKPPGPNAIPADLIKAGRGIVTNQLTTLFTKAAAHAREPLEWKGGYPAPLFKKGRMACPSSYRSILVNNFIQSCITLAWESSSSTLGNQP